MVTIMDRLRFLVGQVVVGTRSRPHRGAVTATRGSVLSFLLDFSLMLAVVIALDIALVLIVVRVGLHFW